MELGFEYWVEAILATNETLELTPGSIKPELQNPSILQCRSKISQALTQFSLEQGYYYMFRRFTGEVYWCERKMFVGDIRT